MWQTDAVVVGAGVVGLAIARELALHGKDVVILERDGQVGSGISSRSSEVIHAGIYYDAGTLKSRLCVRGRHLLYDYCRARNVCCNRMGKLIIAADDTEFAALDAIERNAADNGVGDLLRLDSRALAAIEPKLAAAAAILSPSTGIIDSHGFMQALLADAESGNASLATRTPFSRAEWRAGRWRITVHGVSGAILDAPILINAAGLGAQAVAGSIEGLSPHRIPPLHLARGHYFNYAGRLPFSHLIYPVPVPGGLGTHLTFDLAGRARFGPDVEWIEQIDYSIDMTRRDAFAAAARRIWPGIDADRMEPGYVGIRPKIVPWGAPAGDFIVSGCDDHGLPGLVNLFGIESPGLTASLAIAEHVREMIR
jgi:L-2-hydroxyglutarate oxidase LhgO